MNPSAAIRASLDGAPMIGGVIRATVSAALGDLDGLFAQPGPVFEARVEIHRDADVPGGAWLLRQGRIVDALVRIAPSGDAARPRTICLKVPDAYGRGRDQDLLLASSADGAPLHHAVLPASTFGERLYSSLWLYLAGFQVAAIGVQPRAPRSDVSLPRVGDQMDFMLSGPVSRFRSVGTVTLTGAKPAEDRTDANVTFAARHHGGGLRPLPPATFYRG